MISPKKISAAAAKHEDENLRFRTFLKTTRTRMSWTGIFWRFIKNCLPGTIAVGVGIAAGRTARP